MRDVLPNVWLHACETRLLGSSLHVARIQLNRGVSPQHWDVTDALQPLRDTSMPPYGVAAGSGAPSGGVVPLQLCGNGTLSHGDDGYGVGNTRHGWRLQQAVQPSLSSHGVAWQPACPAMHRKGASRLHSTLALAQ